MKFSAVLAILFIAVVSVTAEPCDDVCAKCRPPQNTDAVTARLVENCACTNCGAEKDDDCVNDGDCAGGLYCAASQSVAKGVCQDACQSPSVKCGTFETCRIIDDQPKCICSLFNCEPGLKMEICATGSREFNNRCEFETHNCVNYKRKNISPLEKLGRGTCEQVRNSIHVESGLHVVL